MQFNKFVFSVSVMLLAGFGLSTASAEQCNKVCRYKHSSSPDYVFAYRFNACELADCFPVPAHNHPPRGNWAIQGAEPDKDRHTAIARAEAALSPAAPDHDHHDHSHSHNHSHAAVPAGLHHHHGENLDDQPVILVDETVGESYLYNPKIAAGDDKEDAAAENIGRTGLIELQSAHIVVFREGPGPDL